MIDLDHELRAHAAGLGPPPAQRARILDRVQRRSSPSSPLRAFAVASGLAMATAAAAVVAVVVVDRLPPATRAIGPTASWESLTGDIAVYPTGSGTWEDGHLVWNDGGVRVSVTPDRGVDLRILTPEAVVEVVGTVFTVVRDAYGTTVDVERGMVAVSCVGAAEERLGAGGHRLCFRNAEAGLGEVLRLQSRGVPPAAWLAETERALAHPWGTEVARTELIGLQVTGLLALDRVDEAAAVGRTLVRRSEAPAGVLASLSRALLDRDGCPAATPFLDALADRGDGEAAVWLASCLVDPAEQRRVLEHGLVDPRPEVRAAIEARLGTPDEGGPRRE